MTTTTAPRTSPPVPTVPGPTAAPTRAAGTRVRRLVGGFFLTMAGVHLGIVAAGPSAYRHFADAGLFGFVRTGWADVFMAAPAFWGLCLFAGEAVLGALLLVGGRAARVGWVGVVLFHLLLMLFGVGVWLWSVPVLLVLVPMAVRDWPQLGATAGGRR
jgi:hypothetical protein